MIILKSELFLIQLENGDITKEVPEEIWTGDIVVLNKDVHELIKTELDVSCHGSDIMDFGSPADYFLENVNLESYKDYIQSQFEEQGTLNDNALEEIREEVIRQILEFVESSTLNKLFLINQIFSEKLKKTNIFFEADITSLLTDEAIEYYFDNKFKILEDLDLEYSMSEDNDNDIIYSKGVLGSDDFNVEYKDLLDAIT